MTRLPLAQALPPYSSEALDRGSSSLPDAESPMDVASSCVCARMAILRYNESCDLSVGAKRDRARGGGGGGGEEFVATGRGMLTSRDPFGACSATMTPSRARAHAVCTRSTRTYAVHGPIDLSINRCESDPGVCHWRSMIDWSRIRKIDPLSLPANDMAM